MLVRKWCSSGFTMLEVLVVTAIIGVILAVGAPAMWFLMSAADRTKDRSQATRIQLAINQYIDAHGRAPGWFHDSPYHPHYDDSSGADTLSDDDVYTNFTSNENLVLSLMGGNNGDAVSINELNPDHVGNGAFSNGRFMGAYYKPQKGELGFATNTVGPDNDFPELMSISSGVPLLYFRASPMADTGFRKYKQVTWDQEDEEYAGFMIRKPVYDYTNASNLMNKYNQKDKSALSMDMVHDTSGNLTGWDMHTSTSAGPNATLAWFMVTRLSTMNHSYNEESGRLARMDWGNTHVHMCNIANGHFIEGGYKQPLRYPGYEYLVMSPGDDGIYFNVDQIQKTNQDHVLFDSTWHGVGGSGKVSDRYGPNGRFANTLYLAPTVRISDEGSQHWDYSDAKAKGWHWAEEDPDGLRDGWSMTSNIPFHNAEKHLDEAWVSGGAPPLHLVHRTTK